MVFENLELISEIYNSIHRFRLNGPASFDECKYIYDVITHCLRDFNVESFLQIDLPENDAGYSFVQIIRTVGSHWRSDTRLTVGGCCNGRHFIDILIADHGTIKSVYDNMIVDYSDLWDALFLLCHSFQIDPAKPWVRISVLEYYEMVTREGYVCDEKTGRILPPPRGRLAFQKKYKESVPSETARRRWTDLREKTKGIPLFHGRKQSCSGENKYCIHISALPAGKAEIEACTRIVSLLNERMDESLLITLPENPNGIHFVYIRNRRHRHSCISSRDYTAEIETPTGIKKLWFSIFGKIGTIAAVRSILNASAFYPALWIDYLPDTDSAADGVTVRRGLLSYTDTH